MPRRINISGTGLEIVLALSQSPGARATELAAVLELPLTTVDAALRVLVTLGIVERDASHRRYTLRAQHAAYAELIALAERMPSMQRAMDVVLRANDAVDFAARDDDGYIVAVEPEAGADLDALDGALERINAGREEAPQVMRFDVGDFNRLLRVVPSLRARAVAARTVTGSTRRQRARRATA